MMIKKVSVTSGHHSTTPLALGNQALRAGKYAEAAAHYEDALRQTPSLEKAIAFNLALAKRRIFGGHEKGVKTKIHQVVNRKNECAAPISSNPKANSGKKIAVVVHYFYPEIWLEIKERLQALPAIFDLFITVPIEKAGKATQDVLSEFPSARIHVGQNIGMDIVPFLSLVPVLSNEGYYAVCKIQTKKGDGHLAVIWRESMLDSLIGSGQNFTRAIDVLLSDEKLCMIGPAALYQSGQRLMYDNAQNLSQILDATYQSKLPDEDWGFFAGTMFWSRVDVLLNTAKLANFGHPSLDDKYEKDGKFEHALERFFGLLPLMHGGHVGMLQPKRGRHQDCDVLICRPETAIGQAHIGDVMRQLARFDSDRDLIEKSGYFDTDYYVLQNKELAGTSIDLIYHYLTQGCYRGKMPCRNFSTFNKVLSFLRESGDERNPLLFYIENNGDNAKISEYIENNSYRRSTVFDKNFVARTELFDIDFYIQQYPKLRETAEDPVDHYFREGTFNELFPNRFFIPREYRALHGDVVEAGIEPFHHYLTVGALEGRRYRTTQWREEEETPFFRYMVLNATLINWHALNARQTLGDLVSIVIPIYGQLDLTRSCLDSISSASTSAKYEVICVDNGSEIGMSDFLENASSRDRRVRYIKNKENYNFSLGCNLGFQESRGAVIVFLNNDTRVTDGWLDELIHPLIDSRVVAVQPKLLYPDNTVQNVGIVFAPKQTLGYPIYADSDPDDPCVKISRDYQAVSAACMAIRSTDFAKAEGFDPLFINGQEDVDLCLRLTHGTNRVCRYQASSIVVHYESKTPGRGRYIALNRKKFIERWRDKIEPDDYKYYAADKYRVASWRKDAEHFVKAGLGISRPTLERINVSPFYFFWDEKRELALKSLTSPYYHNRSYLRNKLVSVVMPTYNRGAVIGKAIESVLRQTHYNFELHVCDDGSSDETSRVVIQYAKDIRVKYHKLKRVGVSVARNCGLEMARGDLIAYLDSDNTWEGDFLETMLAVIDKGKLDAVYCAIHATGDDGTTICYRGDNFDWGECLKENYIDINAFVHTRAKSATVQFDKSLKRLVDWDFILRLTKNARVCYIPYLGVNYYDGEQLLRITRNEYVGDKLSEMQIYIRNKHNQGPSGVAERSAESVSIDSVFENGDAEIYSSTHREVVAPSPRSLSFRIKIGCPNLRVSHEWGDYHFANSMKRSLEKLGHQCTVDCLDAWDSAESLEADVVIVLRGLSRYSPKQNQINLMWNISHPDKVELDEYNEYDHVFVASSVYSKKIQKRLVVPVSCLLQCTDPDYFNPAVIKKKRHELIFVGNSRNVYRRIVKDAVEAGLPVSVYGARWDKFIARKYIAGSHINNNELAGYYASAGIVLNDHWDDMHEYGFLSNRLFDAAACAALVVSDDIEGLSDVFGSSVLTYKTPRQLRDICCGASSEIEYSERLKLSDLIRENHSFDARVKEIALVSEALLAVKNPKS